MKQFSFQCRVKVHAETPQDQLEESDVAMVLDGFRQINPAILAAFVKTDDSNNSQQFEDKTRTSLTVNYSEKELCARKVVERGWIEQNEGAILVTKGPLVMEKRQRAVHKGSNFGTTIGPVEVEPFESPDILKVSPAVKTDLLGSGGKVLCGGSCPEAASRPKLPGDMVPVSWHPLPCSFYHEVLHSLCVKPGGLVCNATESDGLFALTCVTHKAAGLLAESCCCVLHYVQPQTFSRRVFAEVPYVGVCHSQKHADLLKEFLVKKVWQSYQNSDSDDYQVALCFAW